MSEEFLKNVYYISDSVQNWRRGCMCQHIDKNFNFQILTHPIWWNKISKTREELLNDFLKSEIQKLNDTVANNKIIYKYYFVKIS